jgi:hypothetical protein
MKMVCRAYHWKSYALKFVSAAATTQQYPARATINSPGINGNTLRRRLISRKERMDERHANTPTI